MTKDEQRIAVAEACGKKCRLCNNTGLWKQHGEHEWFRIGNAPYEQQPLVQCEHGRHGWQTLPNYPEDLNAAVTLCDHLAAEGWQCEIDNGLDKTWECAFWRSAQPETLPENMGSRDGEDTEAHCGFADTLAGAITQAFLRTKSLWKD